MQLTIIKGALVPKDDLERMDLHKQLKAAGIESKIGATFDVLVVHPRNAKFNSMVFAILTEIAKMLGITQEALRAEIMYGTGRGEDIKLRTGKTVTIIPSMSKTNMSEKELELWWADAHAYLLQEVAIALDGDQQKRLREILGATGENNTGFQNPMAGG